MNEWQVMCLITTFVSLALATLMAQFNWIRPGKLRTVLIFIAGLGVIVPLWMAGIPPQWFEGSKVGFGIGLSFSIGAWIPGGEVERSFRFPLFLGMGLPLLIFNFLSHL